MRRLLFGFLALSLIPSLALGTNTLKKISGDNQKLPLSGFDPRWKNFVGKASFEPLKVQVVDEQGQGVPGVVIEWNPVGGPPDMVKQVNPGGGGGYANTTDSHGFAVLNQMGAGTKSVACYYGVGKFQMAVSGRQTNQVKFDLEVTSTPPRPQPIAGVKIEILEGNNQKVALARRPDGFREAWFQPLKIRVTKDGKPMPDLIVDFEGKGPAPMIVQLEPSSGNASTTRTDKDGIAILNKVGDGNSIYAYYGTGPIQVIASHGAARVTFNLEVR